MSTYSLMAIDLDGTLLNKHGEISSVNKEAIARAVENGKYIVIATGRGMNNLLPYVQQLQLELPIICTNGGQVWRNPTTMYTEYTLDTADVQRMWELAKQYDCGFWGYTKSGEIHKDSFQGNINDYVWLKFGFMEKNKQHIHQIRTELEGWGTLELSNSSPLNIEVNPRGVSKANGLKQVCDLLQVRVGQSIAIGDSLNDFAMIQAAGLGVAMGNAQPAVKEIADVVTVSNDENGVAEIIHTYLLGEGK